MAKSTVLTIDTNKLKKSYGLKGKTEIEFTGIFAPETLNDITEISASGNNLTFTVNGKQITLSNATNLANVSIKTNGEDIASANELYNYFVNNLSVITQPQKGTNVKGSFMADTMDFSEFRLYDKKHNLITDTSKKGLTVDGGLNNDTITGSMYSDTLKGNVGNDVLSGGKGNDVINAGDGNDSITGGLGNDKLTGGKGNDVIIGGLGNDTITGGANNDTFVFSTGEGVDVITDATNGDEIDITDVNISDVKFMKSGKNLVIDFKNNDSDRITINNYFNPKNAPIDKIYLLNELDERTEYSLAKQISERGFSLTGRGTVNGSNESELIDGSEIADKINGKGGDDTINGGLGNDVINGGDGNDTINGGYGNDTLTGGAKGDNDLDRFVFSTGDGADVITDANELDEIVITDVRVTDVEFLKLGNSLVIKYKNNDTDSITINNFFGKEWIAFDAVNSIYLLDENDEMKHYFLSGLVTDKGFTIKGKGLITGSISDDRLTGSDSDDKILGYEGNDTINAGSGKDSIVGGEGNDLISGGAGNDTIIGGQGNDTIDAGEGKNTICYSISDGNDIIRNGGGIDTLLFDKNTQLSLTLGEGDDKNLYINYMSAYNKWTANTITIEGYQNSSSVKYIQIGTKKEELTAYFPERYGTDGDDTFCATEKDEIFYLGKGSDTISFGKYSGNDKIISEAEYDDIGNITNTDTLIFNNFSYLNGYGDLIIGSENKDLKFETYVPGHDELGNLDIISSIIYENFISDNSPNLIVKDSKTIYNIKGYDTSKNIEWTGDTNNIAFINAEDGTTAITSNNGNNRIEKHGEATLEYTYKGGYDVVKSFSNSDDIYKIDTFTKDTSISIYDLAGKDTLNINADADDIRLFFQVRSSGYYDPYYTSIVHKDAFTFAGMKKIFENDNVNANHPSIIGITMYSPEVDIEKLITKDNDDLSFNMWKMSIAKNVSAWLRQNGFDSTWSVLWEGTAAQKQELYSLYNVSYSDTEINDVDIVGSDERDVIYCTPNTKTATGGKGNDVIYINENSNGVRINYTIGAWFYPSENNGSDTIYGSSSKDTLYIDYAYYLKFSTAFSRNGNDLIIKLWGSITYYQVLDTTNGDGTIILKDYFAQDEADRLDNIIVKNTNPNLDLDLGENYFSLKEMMLHNRIFGSSEDNDFSVNGEIVYGQGGNNTITITGTNGTTIKYFLADFYGNIFNDGHDQIVHSSNHDTLYIYLKDVTAYISCSRVEDALQINFWKNANYNPESNPDGSIFIYGYFSNPIEERIDNLIVQNDLENRSGFDLGNNQLSLAEFILTYSDGTIPVYDGENYIINGKTGNDNNLIQGTIYNDIINGNGGVDSIDGRKGNDVINITHRPDTQDKTTIFYGIYYDDYKEENVYGGHDVINGATSADKLEISLSNVPVTMRYARTGNNLVLRFYEGVVSDTSSSEPVGSITLTDYFSMPATNRIDNIIFDSFEQEHMQDLMSINSLSQLIQAIDNSYYNIINGTENDDILAGKIDENNLITGFAGNDSIIGGYGNDTIYGGTGNDTYVLSTLNNNTIITDTVGSNDLISITNINKADLVLRFDLQLDNEGNILDYLSKNMYITSTADFGNTEKGIKVTDQFVEGHSIETITTADGYSITTTQIDQLRENVAGWLHTNGFESVQQIIDSENKTNINNLIAQLQTADWQQV